MFFVCVLDGSHSLKEPAGIVHHAFKVFSRGCILLELEMISFLPIVFKLFFRVNIFTFLSPFLKPGNNEQ